MIITIDGPAGSGKSTVAASLAKRLGAAYLDSGAMYRALTLEALDKGVNLEDSDALAALLRSIRIEVDGRDPDNLIVFVHRRNVTEAIRENRVSTNAHYAATNPDVRKVMVELQRAYAEKTGSVVTEGRDQGTVAFPDADVKFYLEARPEVRARRRQVQMEETGEYVSFRRILCEVVERDNRDTQREVSPLKCPDDAVRIDTSDMRVEEVVERLHELVLRGAEKEKGQGAQDE